MSKQSKRRQAKRAKMAARQPKGPLFTSPVQERPLGETFPVPNGSAKQVSFLAAYALCGLIGRAAKAAGCERQSHTYWMAHDPDYPARFADAQAAANEMLEAEARRRATQGVERMKFYKGQPIIDPRTGKPYVEHEYSDRLLELSLKAHMHEKYAEQRKVETIGNLTVLDPAIQAAIFDTEPTEEPPAEPTEEPPAEPTEVSDG